MKSEINKSGMTRRHARVVTQIVIGLLGALALMLASGASIQEQSAKQMRLSKQLVYIKIDVEEQRLGNSESIEF